MFLCLAIVFAFISSHDAKIRLPKKEDVPECFLPALLQSKHRNIHLICAKSSYCPSRIVNNILGVAWTFYDRNETLTLAYEWDDLCMIASDDFATTTDLFMLFSKCHRTKVVLAFGTDISVENMKALFDIAWSVGVVDVVLSKRVRESCECYSYIPFQRGKCYDTTPVLLGKENMSYFLVEKISGLHSCELRVDYRYHVQHPRSYLRAGWRHWVAFLLTAMNAKAAANSTANNLTAVTLGTFLLTIKTARDFVILPLIRNVHTGICLPIMTQPSVQWYKLLHEFSNQVWFCVMLSFCAAVSYSYATFLKEWTLLEVVIFCYQSLIEVQPQLTILSSRDRLFLLLWIWFCLILNAAYQSGLASGLTLQFTEYAIQTLDEFVSSDLSFILSNEVVLEYVRKEVWSEPKYEPLIRKAKPSQIPYVDLVKPVHGVAYLCSKEDMPGLLPSYRMLTEGTFDRFRGFITLPRSSPLERLVIKSTLRMFDVGAFAFLKMGTLPVDSFEDLNKKERQGLSAISLKGLLPVFLLLLFGCLVAFVVFVSELVQGRKIGKIREKDSVC